MFEMNKFKLALIQVWFAGQDEVDIPTSYIFLAQVISLMVMGVILAIFLLAGIQLVT